MPLVFSLSSSDDDASVDGLDYCFELPKRPGMPILRCRSGNVRVKFDASNQRYGGEYSFTMADGTRREGTFIAEYCPKQDLTRGKSEHDPVL